MAVPPHQTIRVSVIHIRNTDQSMETAAPLPTIDLMGLELHNIDIDQTVDIVIERFFLGKGGRIVTPNVDILRQTVCDPHARKLVESADLVVADGKPLMWAAEFAKTPLIERVAGADLLPALSQMAWKNGIPVFLLGGESGAAASGAQELEKLYPGIAVDHHSPPFGYANNPNAMQAIEQEIANAPRGIVFVGLPFPQTEELSVNLIQRFPDHWFVGVGAAIGFLAGQYSRAPMWMQNNGLEWVYRLMLEPRRLFRRYIINDAPFAMRMMFASAIKRFRQ